MSHLARYSILWKKLRNLHSLNAGAIVSNMEVKLATLGLDHDSYIISYAVITQ